MRSKKKVRTVGRNYVNYTEDTLNDCLDAIINNVMSQRKAAEFYNIPRSTINNKLQGLHNKHIGHPTIFSEEEENSFKQHLIKLSDFGFPVNKQDFRLVIKNYLDLNKRRVESFTDNMPNIDWVNLYLTRHEDLSFRISTNIKRCRAEVDEAVLNPYLDNLCEEIKDVTPERIFNYDETNLSDDPGSKKVVCKRGTKYVENIIDSSKSCVSIMFCANASGQTLPPYVVYKSKNLYNA